jgi:hypothetical protein
VPFFEETRRMTRTVSTAAVAAVLLAAMAVTRSHHFADLIGPGDASVAAFFLGGLLLRRVGWFALLLAVAGLIDLLALWGGVSAACVTPGYALLLPAYGCCSRCRGCCAAPPGWWPVRRRFLSFRISASMPSRRRWPS